MSTDLFDIIILGAGPAGLSAGLYAARSCMRTLIIEKSIVGGQIATTTEVENYPGAPKDSTGPSITTRMAEQAENLGAFVLNSTVESVDLSSNPKEVVADGKTYQAKAVVLATGASPRKVGAKNEELFIGRGVSYCETCDGPFAAGRHVYVVGGGDAAVEEANTLTKFANKVTIIHRRDTFRAAASILEKAKQNEKIEFMTNTEVVEFVGDKSVEELVVKDTNTGEQRTILPTEGENSIQVFIYVGLDPNTDLYTGQLDLENGYIVTNDLMETEIGGVYAAGDLRMKSLRQVVTATADGAIAAIEAENYIDCLD